MTLSAGSRLGPYEVLSPLGAGGMGEVYRARDTRLGREVAIKVLPEAFASDPERLRRFEGEARSASALSDPHIVTVFDVGAERGVHWFASELVEGTDLRALLGDPLPVRKVLDLAEQIAAGLAAAHEKGIVHRDLKPENVLIGRSGIAKIADFGLAKLTEPKRDGISQLPTSDGNRTSAGVVMGTVPYMSPEQARGDELDFRSDQFAFGAILYEMLTGKSAFHKGNAAETMAAILREEPPALAVAAPGAPAPLRWVVERCLSKDREGRYGATSDLHRDLQTLRENWGEAISTANVVAASALETAPSRRGARLVPVAAAAAIAVAAGIALGRLAWKSPPSEPPVYRQITFERGQVWGARFAPDGQTILYAASWKGGPRRIRSTRTDSTESTELPLPNARILSISSMGKAAISIHGTLAEVALAGGAPREILENVSFADWAPDGKDIAVCHLSGGRYRLEYPIGRPLVDPGPAGDITDPRFSPNGRYLAYIRKAAVVGGVSGVDASAVAVYDIARRKETTLTSGWEAYGLAWTPSGEEIWFSARPLRSTSGGLVINAVDLAGRTRVVARVPWILQIEDIFKDGRVLLKHGYWPTTTIFRGPGAATEKDVSWQEFSVAQDLSPDGKTLLLSEGGISGGSEGEILLKSTDESTPAVRLGSGRPSDLSPDGKWAVAISAAGEKLGLLPTRAGQAVDLTTPGIKYLEVHWFPDGKRLIVAGQRSGDPSPRAFEQAISGGVPRPLPVAGASVGPVSPDGTMFASPTESGEIRITPLDGKPSTVIPGAKGNEVLRWSSDGSALFVRADNVPARLLRIDVRTGETTPIAQLAPFDLAGVPGIAEKPPITPDGKVYAYSFVRFLEDLYVVSGMR